MTDPVRQGHVFEVVRTVCGLTEPAASVVGVFSQVSDSSAWFDRRINGPSHKTVVSGT